MNSAQLNCIENDRFALTGNINFSNVIDLYNNGCKHIAGSQTVIVHITLGNIQQSNSACLALLIAWLRHASHRGKHIHYHDTPDFLFNTAKVSGVDEILFQPS